MNKIVKFALLSVSLLVISGGAIAGNIPAIEAAYPTVNPTIIEFLTTLPSLMIIGTVLFSTKIAQKIGYKLTVQLGILLVLIAGVLPVVTSSFTVLFISRMAFGLGVGLFNPLLYAFASNLYHNRELTGVIGLQSAFEGIGAMLMTFIAGQLYMINWRASFIAYALALPILILFSFFIPDVTVTHPTTHKYQEKSTLSRTFILYLVLLVLSVTIYMSVTVKATAILMAKGIGDATDGSNLIALIGLGSMVAGMIFGRVYANLKQATLPIAFALLAISMFLLAGAGNIWIAMLAALLCGFAFRTFIPYLFNAANQAGSHSERHTSLLLMAFNLGIALSPFSIAIAQRLVPSLVGSGLFVGEGILMLVVAVGLFFWQRTQPKTA
ncbi:MAG: MFS transporter [Aerococcus sp.]|nr:MFS transporter [Aerococcus sp.]